MSENIFYDCIVVGGGPGGSTAATILSKKGKHVLLLDKERFPRDKTCGDAISGKSLAVLRFIADFPGRVLLFICLKRSVSHFPTLNH